MYTLNLDPFTVDNISLIFQEIFKYSTILPKAQRARVFLFVQLQQVITTRNPSCGQKMSIYRQTVELLLSTIANAFLNVIVNISANVNNF